MFNSMKTIKHAVFALLAAATFAATASAQILIVDDERVEREAAAYKDFNLQTTDLREQILARRKFVSRGGELEQSLADLEKQKAIIGNDDYEKKKKDLEARYVKAQQELNYLEYVFDQLRQEAMIQVERARQPVIRQILKDHNGQVIMLKRLVLGAAPGIDVTTEFIEQLDAQLPAVTLSNAAKPAAEGQAPAPQPQQ